MTEFKKYRNKETGEIVEVRDNGDNIMLVAANLSNMFYGIYATTITKENLHDYYEPVNESYEPESNTSNVSIEGETTGKDKEVMVNFKIEV